jgi:hypothetical protein
LRCRSTAAAPAGALVVRLPWLSLVLPSRAAAGLLELLLVAAAAKPRYLCASRGCSSCSHPQRARGIPALLLALLLVRSSWLWLVIVVVVVFVHGCCCSWWLLLLLFAGTAAGGATRVLVVSDAVTTARLLLLLVCLKWLLLLVLALVLALLLVRLSWLLLLLLACSRAAPVSCTTVPQATHPAAAACPSCCPASRAPCQHTQTAAEGSSARHALTVRRAGPGRSAAPPVGSRSCSASSFAFSLYCCFCCLLRCHRRYGLP